MLTILQMGRKKGRLYQLLKMPASIMQIVKAIFFEAKVHASLYFYLYLYFYFLPLSPFFSIPGVNPINESLIVCHIYLDIIIAVV
jgi:hypothetical protein